MEEDCGRRVDAVELGTGAICWMGFAAGAETVLFGSLSVFGFDITIGCMMVGASIMVASLRSRKSLSSFLLISPIFFEHAFALSLYFACFVRVL